MEYQLQKFSWIIIFSIFIIYIDNGVTFTYKENDVTIQDLRGRDQYMYKYFWLQTSLMYFISFMLIYHLSLEYRAYVFWIVSIGLMTVMFLSFVITGNEALYPIDPKTHIRAIVLCLWNLCFVVMFDSYIWFKERLKTVDEEEILIAVNEDA